MSLQDGIYVRVHNPRVRQQERLPAADVTQRVANGMFRLVLRDGGALAA